MTKPKPGAKIGRPLLLESDPSIANRIIEVAELCGTKATMCRAAGIGINTLNDWLTRGGKGESPFLEFSQRYHAARANGEKYALRCLKGLSPDNPKAAIKLLAYAEQDSYTDTQNHNVNFGPINLIIGEHEDDDDDNEK